MRCNTGGASTQIIFKHRHDGSGQDSLSLELGKAACEPAAPATIKDGDGHCDDSYTANASILGAELTARDVNGEEGRGGSVSSVPVSQSDFWGASHLGYGVAEVSL